MPTAIADHVRRYHDGDRAAAEVLARRACRLALRTAAVVLGSREQAGDVAQDVAVDLLRSLDKLRDPEAFDAWVHRITVRHAVSALRRRRAAETAEIPLALITEPEEPRPHGRSDPAALLAARAALSAALSELPPKQRLALGLRYVHDLSDAEIATALGCRLGSAQALLSRGRAALRRDPQLSDLSPATTTGGRP